MYFFTLRVVPTADNSYFDRVEGANVFCWAVEDDPIAAVTNATFKVRQCDWTITGIERAPVAVEESDFFDRDLGLQQYKHAQEKGLALFFVGWSRDGKSSFGPVALEGPNDFDLSSYLNVRKTLRQKGRCLHLAAGVRCTKIIKAHSIQRRGALSLIADKNEVYAPSMNFTDTKRSRGLVKFTRQPISQVSTFRGFCGRHDKELFRPIDDFGFVPTAEQILLYAYRSICRELFVKQNAVTLLKGYARESRNKANRSLFSDMLKGSEIGLKNLNRHKKLYDRCLKTQSFTDIEYATFYSRQNPSVTFSGLLCPDSDFLGNQLEDLTDEKANLSLITFCFVPMQDGWIFLFAWHRESSTSNTALFRSLATVVHEGKDLGDCLFRYVIWNCENLAISPTWWESLTERQKEDIERAASYWADRFSPHHHDYLVRGLETISEWKFETVTTNVPPPVSD